MKRTLTMMLKEKIGDCEIEVEYEAGKPTAHVRLSYDGQLEGSFDFEDYQFERLSVFFFHIHEEIKRLEENEAARPKS